MIKQILHSTGAILAKVDTQIFFVSPQILGLIPQSEIRKFFRCASPQIRKIVMINPQISEVSQNANHKLANLQGKKHCFWSWSALVCF